MTRHVFYELLRRCVAGSRAAPPRRDIPSGCSTPPPTSSFPPGAPAARRACRGGTRRSGSAPSCRRLLPAPPPAPRLAALDGLLAVWSYRPPIDEVVRRLKYGRLEYLAERPGGRHGRGSGSGRGPRLDHGGAAALAAPPRTGLRPGGAARRSRWRAGSHCPIARRWCGRDRRRHRRPGRPRLAGPTSPVRFAAAHGRSRRCGEPACSWWTTSPPPAPPSRRPASALKLGGAARVTALVAALTPPFAAPSDPRYNRQPGLG